MKRLEAALTAHKTMHNPGCHGRGRGVDELLPPEQEEAKGLALNRSGVSDHEQAITENLGFDGSSTLSADEMRGAILRLEAVMMEMKDHQIEIKTTHHFAPGIYMREIFIPKGTTLTGKIHKTEHLNILSQGVLSVWTEDGMKTLSASTVIVSKPGIKRVGYAHEDSVWITVHHNPDEARDVDLIEERLIAKTFDDVLGHVETKQIAGGK